MFFWQKKQKQEKSQPQGEMLVRSLKTNIQRLQDDYFADDETIVYRKFRTKEPHSRLVTLVYADNMAKHDFLSHYVIAPLMNSTLPPKSTDNALAEFLIETVIQSDGADLHSSFEHLIESIVGGAGVVLIDNCKTGIAIDAQGWEKRDVAEPPSESVVRGPRQGFTEELGVNTSLIRRKIKSHRLKTKYMQVGKKTKTKIAIVYVEKIVLPGLVVKSIILCKII